MTWKSSRFESLRAQQQQLAELDFNLIIRCPESPPNIFVIQDLHLKAEVFLHVLDDHDQEGQLDSQSLVGVRWAADVGGSDVGAGNLKD